MFVASLMMLAAAAGPGDLAAAFGAREGVREVSLSPDGSQIAFMAPLEGQGSALYVAPTYGSTKPRRIAVASGAPERLGDCSWINADRLICSVYGVAKKSGFTVGFNRMVLMPVHPSDKNKAESIGGATLLRVRHEDPDTILLGRVNYRQGLPFVCISKMISKTGAERSVDCHGDQSVAVVTDRDGQARAIGFRKIRGMTYMDTGELTWRYIPRGQRDMKPLSVYNSWTREGFVPVAVDDDKAWGFRKHEGRVAVFTRELKDNGLETLVFSHPDVDVSGVIRTGPDRRVIGVSYTTDRRHIEYLDPKMKALATSLSRAIPNLPIIDILDSSEDEQKLLIRASSDVDPGRYYLLDRATKQMRILLQSRPELEGLKLAPMKPVTYTARDGARIPAYLTLPVGGVTNLPTIVLPHGGPSARDDWGFDWMAQYFAARGYAVLQPNFRGSAGYGDSHLPLEGYRQWQTAIGDITDGGRWLLSQGIADPARLVIVGWSYGGYAALQSAATEPSLFRSVVAIAPVTDLKKLLGESEGYSDHALMRGFLGAGQGIDRGSPAELAEQITAPVMLVHGKLDQNVPYSQSERMAARLKAIGREPKFVSFDKLDHQLDDAAARTKVLAEADAFIRASLP